MDRIATLGDIEANNSLIERFRNLNIKGGLTKNEFNEMQQLLHENQHSLLNENQKIKSKIITRKKKVNKIIFQVKIVKYLSL